MIEPQMLENLEDLKCACMSDSPVTKVICDHQCSEMNRLLCDKCCQNKKQYALKMKIHEFSQIILNQQRDKLASFETCISQYQNSIKLIQQELESIKYNCIDRLDQLLKMTQEWIQSLENQKTQAAQYSFIKEFEAIIENQRNPKVRNYTAQCQAEIDLVSASYLKRAQSYLDQFQATCASQQFNKLFGNIQELHQKQWKLNLECISKKEIQKANVSYAMTFNQDSSLLLMSLDSVIKVFNIRGGEVKQLQTLQHISKYVTTLNVFKRGSLFLSTSFDSFLRLESFNLLQRSKYLQKFEGHSDGVFCCKMNPLNTVIISGSFDKSIKFWSKSLNSSWKCFQTISELNGEVYDLSINQKGDQVISCGVAGFILVIEQQKLNSWVIIQKIQVNQLGEHLSYISDNQFVFQPFTSQRLEFYTLNKETKEYKHSQNLKENYVGIINKGNSRFPIIYHFNKGFVLKQAGQALNFIKLIDVNSLNCVQHNVDEFKDSYIQAALSDEGTLLATWTKNQQVLQIWRCVY
ncbi:unnamed protein product (macronuclear) [Paramecium tetraurelia]|uniref:Uncharacterized protein n=1 Tax=Paramecium tetraurelia TaxID=5888 RepID=A0CI23_PARTE|nr:uncharacterized protein GSPATT00038544001 [Paramecium tetraurelia]CAK70440.1 unnamed protein product [Paramecium tetraurelia]|eukprot:XP_001437837.1 hypothetical protein (macronuclear) [Paramecium tetraurelia strain d4-2]